MSGTKVLDEDGAILLTSNIKTLADATYPANAAIASPYNSSISYIVGSYCLHNGLLYKCNTDIPVGGEVWTAAHWDQVNVATELVLMSKIVYTNTVVHQTSFLLNGTYEDYPYRASIPLAEVTVETIPEVVFSVEDVQSSILAPVAHTYNGGIYIYANDVPYGTLEGELDTETFLAQVTGSGVMTFAYTDSWNVDPSTYGITLTGIPNSGDSIEVTYNADESAAIMEILGSIVIPTIICWNATGPNPVPEPGETDIYGLPAGGTAGQVLTKVSSTDFNAEWMDIPDDGKGITLLWENASPSSSFGEQIISLNLSSYDAVLMIVMVRPNEALGYMVQFLFKGILTQVALTMRDGQLWGVYRMCKMTSTGVEIGAGINQNNGSAENERIIPYRIYGVKVVTA